MPFTSLRRRSAFDIHVYGERILDRLGGLSLEAPGGCCAGPRWALRRAALGHGSRWAPGGAVWALSTRRPRQAGVGPAEPPCPHLPLARGPRCTQRPPLTPAPLPPRPPAEQQQKQQQQEEQPALHFGQVVAGETKFDVSRSFAAMLQLINNHNVRCNRARPACPASLRAPACALLGRSTPAAAGARRSLRLPWRGC
jgi:hypothetical protein